MRERRAAGEVAGSGLSHHDRKLNVLEEIDLAVAKEQGLVSEHVAPCVPAAPPSAPTVPDAPGPSKTPQFTATTLRN